MSDNNKQQTTEGTIDNGGHPATMGQRTQNGFERFKIVSVNFSGVVL